MAALIGLFAGALVGHWLWPDWGAALGGIAGFLAGVKLLPRSSPPAPAGGTGAQARGAASPAATVLAAGTERELRERVAALERRVASLERALAATGAALPEPAASTDELARSASLAVAPTAVTPAPAPAVSPELAPAAESQPAPAALPTSPAAEPQPAPAALATAAAAEAQPAPAGNPLWRWFTGGNAVSRIGAVALFFGVAFLLRYLAGRFDVPVAWRLGAVALCGLALVGVGVRLAGARPAYGLTLQGAGAGVLYLTIYAAFRLYDLLPALPAIALLVGVSALTVRLAMRGDAQPLAGLALAGGFVAPMLVARGGEPLWLFGWFAVLNAAIFALAWTRAWRALDAVGFAFTFVLGAFWGHGFYRPEHYGVVQPFLALFVAFYVAIAILHARRSPLVPAGPVDGLLTFGVPLAGFALQAALVRDVRYGAAWSALAIAAAYGVLFAALRRRAEPGLVRLARAFLSLAAIFALLAVPFALDNRESAALWAIGGAGAFWIGVRQGTRALRLSALVVSLAAGAAFAASGIAGADDPPFANAFFAGAIAIALSGLVAAFVADRAGEALPAAERRVVPLLFAWGALWWLAAGGAELVRRFDGVDETHAVLAWVAASVALALALRRPLRWPRLAGAGVALLPTMGVAALGDFDLARTTLATYGWAIWPCAWLVHWRALRAADASAAAVAAQPAPLARAVASRLGTVHALSALALVAQLSWEASEWIGRWTAPYSAWMPCAAALPAVAFLALVVRWRDTARWPAVPHGRAYARGAGGPVALLLAVWIVAVNVLSPGDASPLPYVPLASPLDLTLAAALWALAAWSSRIAGLAERARYAWLGAGLFVALNGLVFRTAHHWADVPWRLSSMLASRPVQAALTLAWSATALALMVVATRRRLRPLWMVGAALLAAVVVKLFVADLAALSGLPRVVAFLGVGALLLAIGYLSPLPPAAGDGDGPARSPPA